MKRFFALFVTLAALCAAVPARADTAIPEGLEQLKKDGAMVEFMGHAYGVDGWRIVGKAGGDAKYAYTTPEGGIILGILLDPKGASVTGQQLRAFKDKLDGGQGALPGADKSSAASVKAEKLYAAVENAGWARTGDSQAPYLYLFINTLCDHCQKMWRELEAPVKSGRLQVRLVPFGGVEQNRVSGAALLSADDPAAAWNAFMTGDNSALTKDKVKPGMLEKLDANTALFREWKMQGPPFTIYRRPSDGQIIVVAGKPENMMLILADLTKGE